MVRKPSGDQFFIEGLSGDAERVLMDQALGLGGLRALASDIGARRDGDKRAVEVPRYMQGENTWAAAALAELFAGTGTPGGTLSNVLGNASYDASTGAPIVDMSTTGDKTDLEGLFLVGLGVDCTVAASLDTGNTLSDGYTSALRRKILDSYEVAVFPKSGTANPSLGWTRLSYFDLARAEHRPIPPFKLENNSGRVVLRRVQSPVPAFNLPVPVATGRIHVAMRFGLKTLAPMADDGEPGV